MAIPLYIPAGTHIADAAAQLCAAAAEHGTAAATFNGVAIQADRGSTVEGVVAAWDRDMKALAAAFNASPKGQAMARERVLQLEQQQRDTDALMRALPALDWKSDVAVLGWLCGFTAAADHVEIIVDRDAVLEAFARQGFEASVNTGDAYCEGDRENAYRYLVGQALDGIRRVGVPHGILLSFTDDWRRRFDPTARCGEAA